MRLKLLCIAAAATALLGAGFFQSARANERVQLKEFMVKVFNKRDTKTRQLPITVFFDVKSKSEAKSICKVAPRYREAILNHLNRVRYPLYSKGKLNIAAIHNELKPVIREVDRNNLILKVKVSQGIPKLKKSAALHFNRAGCMRVK